MRIYLVLALFFIVFATLGYGAHIHAKNALVPFGKLNLQPVPIFVLKAVPIPSLDTPETRLVI